MLYQLALGRDGPGLWLFGIQLQLGQGLKDLVASQSDQPMKICYFGKDPMLTRLSMPAFTMEEAVNIKQSCTWR